MSALASLLDVQGLDLEADALKKRRAELPEREALRACEAEAVELDTALTQGRSRKAELDGEEERLGGEVSSLASRAEALQLELYSGKRKSLDETNAGKQEHEALKQQQAELEEQELALLERIEELDGELSALEARRGEAGERAEELAGAIAAAEAEIDAELASLDTRREAASEGLPEDVLAAYGRGRANARQAGVAAARLGDGSCEGCRVKLPILEYKRLREAEERALIQCPQCRRVLVR